MRMSSFKCLLCSWRFDKPVLTLDYEKKSAVINGKWGFHMYDTHGIPLEILPEWTKAVMAKLSGDTEALERIKRSLGIRSDHGQGE